MESARLHLRGNLTEFQYSTEKRYTYAEPEWCESRSLQLAAAASAEWEEEDLSSSAQMLAWHERPVNW